MPTDRIDAKHIVLPPLASVEARSLLPFVENEIRVGRVPEGHPGQDAARLVGRRAGRKAERGKVGTRADRPADDISGDDALGDRLPGDLLSKQPLEVERALAVAGKDDRPSFGTSFTNSSNAAATSPIGEVERGLCASSLLRRNAP